MRESTLKQFEPSFEGIDAWLRSGFRDHTSGLDAIIGQSRVRARVIPA